MFSQRFIIFIYIYSVLTATGSYAFYNQYHQDAMSHFQQQQQIKSNSASRKAPQLRNNFDLNIGIENKILECKTCQRVTAKLLYRLGASIAPKSISEESGKLCTEIDWVIKSSCEYFMKNDIEAIIELITKQINPGDICKHLAYCGFDSSSYLVAEYGNQNMMPFNTNGAGMHHPQPLQEQQMSAFHSALLFPNFAQPQMMYFPNQMHQQYPAYDTTSNGNYRDQPQSKQE